MGSKAVKSKSVPESKKAGQKKSVKNIKEVSPKRLTRTKTPAVSKANAKSIATVNSKSKKSVAKKKEAPRKSGKGNAELQYQTLILEHRENGRKLARSILRRWRVHMPNEEIDSIVDLGLCEAAQRFSPKKGASFMTFFFYHLRGHLVRAVARATQASSVLNGPKEGEDEEISSDIISSYGTFVDNELNAQRDQENPEQIILRREKITFCRDAMSGLDSLEKIVLERSYGDDETLVDIAKSLGYSRCHISRVKKAALIRLKSVLFNSRIANEGETKKQRPASIRSMRTEKTARRKINSMEIAESTKKNGSKAA